MNDTLWEIVRFLEMATFNSKCSEDENENVVRASLKLRDAVENMVEDYSTSRYTCTLIDLCST